MDNTQKRQDMNEDNADHEMRDLMRLRVRFTNLSFFRFVRVMVWGVCVWRREEGDGLGEGEGGEL